VLDEPVGSDKPYRYDRDHPCRATTKGTPHRR